MTASARRNTVSPHTTVHARANDARVREIRRLRPVLLLVIEIEMPAVTAPCARLP